MIESDIERHRVRVHYEIIASKIVQNKIILLL
jgi:hypothetical protein